MGSQEKMARFSEVQAKQVDLSSLAFQRLDLLLDPQSYVSLDSLVESVPVGTSFARSPIAGDGIWTGYGTIAGRLVYVAAQDPAVYGGSIGVRHAAKIAKVIDLALTAGAPFIGLYESGGVRVEEGLAALEAVSGVLARMTAAAGEIPLICAIFGPCAGSASFFAGISDVVILSTTKSTLTVNGPGVIAAVENNSLTPAQIGGAAVHSANGLATFVEPDEPSMVQRIRQILDYLPDNADGFTQVASGQDDPNRCDLSLDTMASALDTGLDIRMAVSLIVDQGSLIELQPDRSPELLTGMARLDGRVTGVLACSGSRFTMMMAEKAAGLTALCDRFAIPLVTLIDSEGFELSSSAEQNGLARAGAKLFKSGRVSRSPRISVILGKAFGPVYVSLVSKGSGADLVLAWPTAEIAAVSPDTAAHILYRQSIAAAQDPHAARQEWVDRYTVEIASPYAAASQGLVDEVILPSATRPRLISAMSLFE